MNKIKDFVKKNYKVVISFILGMIVCIGIGVSAVATKDVVYDNSKSGLTSTNLQGAIDELNTKATTKIEEAKKECPAGYKCIKTNFMDAYTYNQTSGASNYCITGEESTCVETLCYKNKTSGSCPAGTIIKYAVNSNTTKYFHVLHDDGATMTLQQRENTVYNTAWSSSDNNSKGPLTILPALENATSGWTNVNDQTYKMGTTVFKDNAYTGCWTSCENNAYTLPSRTAKARMITAQEAYSLGCKACNGCPTKSCPTWMSTGSDYWTMSGDYTSGNYALDISTYSGNIQLATNITSPCGIRAVVVINK